MDNISKLKELISKVDSNDSKQNKLKLDSQGTEQDNIFSRAGLNISEEEWEIDDNFKKADENAFNVEILKLRANKEKAEEISENEKLILDENNAEKITEYLQSKIDTSTLPDNANMNNSRLIVNEKGEVTAISIKLTDEKGNFIGNVEYDTDGNIKHIGQVKILKDGKFKIDEKYYDKDGKEIKSNDKQDYERTYDVNDLKEVLDIINNSKEYNMIFDANSDGVIDIQDFKNIGFNIPFDTKIKDIKKSNLENEKNDNLADVDHEIGVSKQGGIGDCWLLATLNSLSYTEKGKQIIKDAITTNDDGTYTVNFQGVDTSITISDEELQKIKELGVYSSGDDDVLLMEIATEKIMDLIKDGKIDAPDFLKNAAINGSTSISGGWLSDMIYLLTGGSSSFATTEADKNDTLDKIKNNPEEYAAFMAFTPNAAQQNPVVKDVNGNNVELITGHAWSIKSVDGDTVTIVNPWDSRKSYTIPRSELMKHINTINYTNLSQYKGKKECSNNIRFNEDGSDIARIEKRDKSGIIRIMTQDSEEKENEEDDDYTRKIVNVKIHGNISETIETVYDKDGNIKNISVTEEEYDDKGTLVRTTKKQYNGSGYIESSFNKIHKNADKENSK